MDDKKKIFAEIPSAFHSFQLEGPFRKCIECERDLLQDNCEYVIEKAIRNYPDYETQDIIFDYAICMECAEKIHNELSKESRVNIEQFFAKNLNMNDRAKAIAEAKGDINKMIGQCMISKKTSSDSTEFQVFAHCVGNKINLSNPPYMLSGEVLNELAELLSDKTREDLGGFFDKHFSPDPTLFENTPRLILI